nr:unnamed protein product [Digitaria exilis]
MSLGEIYTCAIPGSALVDIESSGSHPEDPFNPLKNPNSPHSSPPPTLPSSLSLRRRFSSSTTKNPIQSVDLSLASKIPLAPPDSNEQEEEEEESSEEAFVEQDPQGKGKGKRTKEQAAPARSKPTTATEDSSRGGRGGRGGRGRGGGRGNNEDIDLSYLESTVAKLTMPQRQSRDPRLVDYRKGSAELDMCTVRYGTNPSTKLLDKYDIQRTPSPPPEERAPPPPPPTFENPWCYEWAPPQGYAFGPETQQYTFGPGAQDDEDDIEEDLGGREMGAGTSGAQDDDEEETEDDSE